MSDATPTILFAGGGTGGHLYPSIAAAERLADLRPDVGVHFACSDRPIDAAILEPADVPFTPLPARPFTGHPLRFAGFAVRFLQTRGLARLLMRRLNVVCVVTMGGFVAAPVAIAARRLGVPVLLVNLDAAAGKANRFIAARSDRLFSVFEDAGLGVEPRRVEPIAMPLRRASIGPADPGEARLALGLDPARSLLLVTGGSSGARTINQALVALLENRDFRAAVADWSVLHQAGPSDHAELNAAYACAGVEARVVERIERMGAAWRGATAAIARAGASTVAEAQANRTPTIFMPYPFHADEHQRRNAEPLVAAGGAVVVADRRDGGANAERLLDPLLTLMRDASARQRMAEALAGRDVGDGAERLARAALETAGLPPVAPLGGAGRTTV